jgi:hypothetical protein
LPAWSGARLAVSTSINWRIEPRDRGAGQMQTVLYVSSMTLGDEVEVRRAHERFPVEALANGHSVDQISAFIGSGFYALQLRFAGEDGDFQNRFREFVQMPQMQEFFDALRPYVDELPAADSQTAELHLASPLLHWERGMTS